MSHSTSSFSWLDHLNAVEQQTSKTSSNDISEPGALSEDLRSQLEAWTTVAFSDDPLNCIPSSFHSSDRDESAATGSAKLEENTTAKDPSPYAKRPFGHFGHNHSLERGFNAFNPSEFDNNSAFGDIYAGLGFGNIVDGTAADGSHALFAAPVSFTDVPVPAAPAQAAPVHQHFTASTPLIPISTDSRSVEPPVKKKKLSTSSPASASGTPSSADGHASPASPAVTSIIGKKSQQTLMTKAALLAAQAAELAAKKGVTPEEEAARQAELNRIAAEDDKRRRNTAASARFRVKKKQREAALEDTVKGLEDKIARIEKELEASKAENNFLRDLVIRKVGLSDLPGSAGGRISGGQEGMTGMGTRVAF